MSTTKSMPKRSKTFDRPRLIKTDADYDEAMARVDELFGSKPGTADGDELELLLHLVERYEEAEWPIDLPDPVTAIRFRLSQQGMTVDDLVPLLGSKKAVTEIVSGKKSLSLDAIRTLTRELGIPAEALLK
jgi:HTH-type transcriptional regulator/antitoxin HigA